MIHQIQELLLNEWDPIGIVDVVECLDEYDSYAEELLRSGETRPGEIAQYLAEVRSIRMGLGSIQISKKEWEVAEKLAAVLKDA